MGELPWKNQRLTGKLLKGEAWAVVLDESEMVGFAKPTEGRVTL